MTPIATIALNVGLAWAAGTLIGLDRSFSGRSAGFRTHALVSLAASAVAVLSLEPMFFSGLSQATHLDPSRLSQGVMAGIGFLGAGVIFKEGLSVQGLTTAASVWSTAAVGFLFGVGMWHTGAILVTLSLFRIIENRAPWRVYSVAVFRFAADQAPTELELAKIVGVRPVYFYDMSYRLTDGGKVYEYTANLETPHGRALRELADRLRGVPGLLEFELSRFNK
jgi:putative Mg2+ transporter-C (MgtC) family protein